jgi:hypothetical protein
MSAEAWIALGALAFTILVQAAVIAFLMGGLFARVKAVEARPDNNDCKHELGILTTKFIAMEATLKTVSEDLRNLLTGNVVPARRASNPR